MRRLPAVGRGLALAVCGGAGVAVALSGDPQSAGIPEARAQAVPAGVHGVRGVLVRARVTAIEPSRPSIVAWRSGGEGVAAKPLSGELMRNGREGPLALGEWSDAIPAPALMGDEHPVEPRYFTLTAGDRGRRVARGSREWVGYSRNAVFEVEILRPGAPPRRLTIQSPDGASATFVIPGSERTGIVTDYMSVAQVASARAAFLAQLPWAEPVRSSRFAVLSDLGGYGRGHGRGARTTDPAVPRTELRSLFELGVNSLRSAPDFLVSDPSHSWKALIPDRLGFPVQIRRVNHPNDAAGCPFAEDVPERAQAAIDKAFAIAAQSRAEELWFLTVDEIPAVTDYSDISKAHLAECERCARGFREFVRRRGVTPAGLGVKRWSEVRPIDVWQKQGPRPWLHDRGLGERAYLTRDFLNVATASLFTPLRDAFARANTENRALQRRDPRAARRPWLYSYALRGNTFLRAGHSLDFFEFYRHADNAVVYETSNRDARTWSWDSYLTDVQRVVARELGVAKTGIYVKPHRGAPVQRMLSAVSRGSSLVYWYTFGPDYWKGDSFSNDRESLALTSKAAHLLHRAEHYLSGTWRHAPRVALVKPETTQRWMQLSGDPPALRAAWENAKWTYVALQHAHVPVDPLDEELLATLDLSRYAIVYVSGTHVTRRAARALDRYVRDGGTLYTSGIGLSRDERNAPLGELDAALGLARRVSPELGCDVEVYGAGQLASIEGCAAPAFRLATSSGALLLRFGREILAPRDAGDVVLRFSDQHPALVAHRHGKGRVIVAGFYAGLEYGAPVMRRGFDATRDFSADARALVSSFALERAPSLVEVSHPLVEAVLLNAPEPGKYALTLANWGYRDRRPDPARSGSVTDTELVPARGVVLTLAGLGSVRRAVSSWTGQELALVTEQSTGRVSFVLPELGEGDVVVLD